MLTPNLRRPPGAALAALGAACLVGVAAPAAAPAGASAKTQTLTVKLPKAGQVAVATASVKTKSGRVTVKARNGDGLIVTGGISRRGRVAVLVARPQGDEGSGAVTFEVRGARQRPRSTKLVASAFAARGRASAPGCKGGELAKLLPKPLVRAGRAKGDVAALGAAAAKRVCGQPAAADEGALLGRLGLASGGSGSAAPGSGSGGLQPSGGRLRGVTGSTRCPSWGRGGKVYPGAECRANLPVPPDAPPPQCGNGVDDDGDGQIDHREGDAVRPDPGCTGAKDETESGEPAVGAECAASSGVSAQGGADQLALGVNAGCPAFDEVRVNTAPPALTCTAHVASSWGANCVVWKHDAAATTNDGQPTTQLDMELTLRGAVDCTVPATVSFVRGGEVVGELVEPVEGCNGGGGGPGPGDPGAGAACADGVDNDGDGQTDARGTGSGDPDPGCSGASDTTEGSEVALPAGCDVLYGNGNGAPVNDVRALVQSCGTIRGVWFKPPGTPGDCEYQHAPSETGTCTLDVPVVEKTFPGGTPNAVLLSTWVAAGPTCGGPVTVAVTLADGQVAELRGVWNC